MKTLLLIVAGMMAVSFGIGLLLDLYGAWREERRRREANPFGEGREGETERGRNGETEKRRNGETERRRGGETWHLAPRVRKVLQ